MDMTTELWTWSRSCSNSRQDVGMTIELQAHVCCHNQSSSLRAATQASAARLWASQSTCKFVCKVTYKTTYPLEQQWTCCSFKLSVLCTLVTFVNKITYALLLDISTYYHLQIQLLHIQNKSHNYTLLGYLLMGAQNTQTHFATVLLITGVY